MANLPKNIEVAVGVITKNELFFVCRRQAHQHQGNKWEFPGGKLDADESVDDALKRELNEEVGIVVEQSAPLMFLEYSYPDKNVSLHVFIVTDFTGNAHGAEGQETQWLSFEALKTLDFPAANKAIIEKLALQRLS
jgi:8-oxo-dGTP diphosphatase